MKTAISVPDEVFNRAEAAARKLNVSRSELYSRAVAAFVEQYEQKGVTAALDEVYAREDSALEPSLTRAQVQSLDPDSW